MVNGFIVVSFPFLFKVLRTSLELVRLMIRESDTIVDGVLHSRPYFFH